MKKNFCWFVCGCLMTCVLGATKVVFDHVFCEVLNANKTVAVGPAGNSKGMINILPESSALFLTSPDGKIELAMIVDNTEALIVVKSPKGQKITKLSK